MVEKKDIYEKEVRGNNREREGGYKGETNEMVNKGVPHVWVGIAADVQVKNRNVSPANR